MTKAPRMVLKAYVGDGGVLHWRNDEGSVELGHIYAYRPTDARYAIAQREQGDFICIDLYECVLDANNWTVNIGKHMIFPELDAAVMAAQMSD